MLRVCLTTWRVLMTAHIAVACWVLTTRVDFTSSGLLCLCAIPYAVLAWVTEAQLVDHAPVPLDGRHEEIS